MDIFEDIKGHAAVKQGLLHALLTGRLHHALLFSGIEGIGKTMLAKAFIQSMMCVESSPQRPQRCLKCSNCRRIASNSHPDLIEISTDTATLKIDQIRELQRRLGFAPFEGDRRFVIIQDVHKMQDAAANCLLKTLEEPDSYTTFILITPQVQRLLPTIISRCQNIRFAPFSMEETVAFLLSQRGIARELAVQIAALADGSFGLALQLADESYQRLLLDTFNAILETSSALECFETAGLLKGKKDMADHILVLLMTYMRDLMALKANPESPVILSHYRARMLRCLGRISRASIERAVCTIQEIREAFYGNANELVAWEHLMIGMHGVIF